MAALQYLESRRNDHPELSDWYNTLADLYQRKLWHQLSLKLEQFVALAVFLDFKGIEKATSWQMRIHDLKFKGSYSNLKLILNF
uniref:26S proteasome non-ATPase regulatory subunit 13 homolog A-like n=1 Tax=Nicotiana sylvestris TaxID=4096 RepID=A0A1U7X7M7_NICSY|nr:PREDICTED: 26S proteasome non-ATPase regulatory subunit 13 homolog A-like [Nicotiana sylvestris]